MFCGWYRYQLGNSGGMGSTICVPVPRLLSPLRVVLAELFFFHLVLYALLFVPKGWMGETWKIDHFLGFKDIRNGIEIKKKTDATWGKRREWSISMTPFPIFPQTTYLSHNLCDISFFHVFLIFPPIIKNMKILIFRFPIIPKPM